MSIDIGLDVEKLKTTGFIVIKNAINNPSTVLDNLKHDTRVHSDQMWDIRLSLKKYFKHIFNTDNLAASFDGNLIGQCESIDWHVDQNMSRDTNIPYVQGVLALKPSKSTHLLSNSHRYFNSLATRNCDKKNPVWEYYNIPENDPIWRRGLIIETPKLNAGDLLIFDSRLVHSVSYNNYRAVVYVSMMPRTRILNHLERLRKRGFLNGWMTTHWCDRFIKRDISGPIRKSIPKRFRQLI